MLRAIAPVIACLTMVTVVACGKSDPVDNNADAAGPPAIIENAPDPTGAPPAKATPAAAATAIPAALHGRWGLTPMDCTSTKGDAKGLLVIEPDKLTFYESRAVPARDAQTRTDSISGNFGFTGEGQSWTKFEALELKGHDLVRTESNPVASFTYARCK